MASNPRQTVIDFLSAPLAPVHTDLVLSGETKTQDGTRRTSGGLGALASTIRFLKERTVPAFYACSVLFEDDEGHVWEMVCLVQQNTRGEWIFRNGTGGLPRTSRQLEQEKRKLEMAKTSVVLVSGLGTEGGFYAGGYLIEPDERTEQENIHVTLTSFNGVTLEDEVRPEDDGRVLFVTDQFVLGPVYAIVNG
jgi:hypothetical protein